MKKIGTVGLDFSKVDIYFANVSGADTSFKRDGRIIVRIPHNLESLEQILDDLTHELQELLLYRKGYVFERCNARRSERLVPLFTEIRISHNEWQEVVTETSYAIAKLIPAVCMIMKEKTKENK